LKRETCWNVAAAKYMMTYAPINVYPEGGVYNRDFAFLIFFGYKISTLRTKYFDKTSKPPCVF
jgi:hypothetical protein